ncbi:hypothetical protein LY90DRAFT_699137 [Neocallimastix californiae]|uniref:MATH domain-containing protein n=1 Tax=Neocallimastix californiae TaxID=1754190 RepID=A0A1Y2ETN2_9FUNG|nr:hypothetical protein LY90DRAFT_699137 [Neocallimastix californiae]|eukprot:ORY74912.1 hypothetical protein LY90DRAFT_699137 [Neocallimastix californiae]
MKKKAIFFTFKSFNGNNDDNSKEKEIGEDYYEWNIESWKRLTNSEKESIEFIALGYKWEITIFPDGDNEDSRGYISLNLKFLGSSDENNSEDLNMYFKYVLVIRNYKDYSCYTLKYSNTAINLSKEFNEIKYDKFFKKDENFCRFLIKDDKLTVGIIIKEFNYNLESFRNDIKKKLIEMDSYEGESCDDDFYEYELDNCDKLTINDEIISPEFTACGHKWKIILSLNSILYKGFASLMLKNEDLRDNQILFSKFVAYIRNYRSYSLYKFLVKKDFNLFTEKFNRRGSYKLTSNKLFFNNTIKNNDEKVDKQEKENEKKNDNEDSKNDKEENKCDEDNINVFNKLIDNNKLIIGFYIKTFKNATLEQIMEKVMNYTSCDKYPETSSDKINYSEYFYEWEAEWDYNDDSSPYNFILRWYSYKWNVIINDNKFNPNDKSYISLYFKLEDDLEEKDEIKQSPVYVKYALYIRNSKKPLYEIKYSESIVPITKEHACRGFSKFILREDFFKLLENDRFIFGIYIHIYDNYDEEKNELSNEDEIIKDLIEEKNFGRDYNYTDPKKK